MITKQYIEELRKTNESFNTEDFCRVDTKNLYFLWDGQNGTKKRYPLATYGQEIIVSEILDLPEGDYPLPPASPDGKKHPYLYFTEDDIPEIKKTLEHPHFKEAAKKFWEYANAENFTGIYPEKVEKSGLTSRWDIETNATLESKAFAYAITKNERYGLEAIIGAKNAMLTVFFTPDIHPDLCHGPNRLMDIVAKVFDWCYDLLTEKDKKELILGVQNRLFGATEYNLFRISQGLSPDMPSFNAVSGHGTGSTLIKKFVSLALVFYSEVKSWWNYIGGRYFDKYIPVFEATYVGGWASQGTANGGYGAAKYSHAIVSAYLIETATGHLPSHARPGSGIDRAAYFLASHLNGGDRYFTTGDGPRYPEGAPVPYQFMLFTAALYKDPAMYAMAKHYSEGFTKFDHQSINEMTVPMVLILASRISEENKNKYQTRGDGVELINYFSGMAGTMSVRNAWDGTPAVSYMKIGEMTMANHDIADHGTFQLYYKGMLAGSSGAYKKYGSPVHICYLQATVAHNGLLIFDPSKVEKEPVYNEYGRMLNMKSYYYSGGQRQLSEAGTIENWLSGKYNMGKVTGADYEYKESGLPHYAYIGGDITAAYPEDTVERVERRMLTVYTERADAPMLFFTFDSITSVDPSFKKTFLLHTIKEPEINEDGISATVTSEHGGRLTLNIVSGAEKITKLGGCGKAFWINDKNCTDEYAPDDYADTIWGRLEIGMQGNKSDELLCAMYTSDADKNVNLDIEKIDTGSDYTSVLVENKLVSFARSKVRTNTSFSADVPSNSDIDVYISGLCAGTWVLTQNASFREIIVKEESGFLYTKASGGKLLLTYKS